jgi:hypothetical protein
LCQSPPQQSPSVPKQPASAQPPAAIIQEPATQQQSTQQPVVNVEGEEQEPSLLKALLILALRITGGVVIGYILGKAWIWASAAISDFISSSLLS